MKERHRRGLQDLVGEGARFDCPMAEFTTFRVGGRADAVLDVENLTALQRLVVYLKEEGIRWMPVGWGSNMLVRDEGLEGAVIRLKGELAELRRTPGDAGLVVCGGGTALRELNRCCRRWGLGGLAFLAGIPGTVGGAVSMNAGAFGGSTAEVAEAIGWLDENGRMHTTPRERLNYGYRSLGIRPDADDDPSGAWKKGAIIVEASLRGRPSTPGAVTEEVNRHLAARKRRQPLEYPSAGSVFKNPPGDHAGRLIERAGLKGERIGGAVVSDKHANFIVNTGGARAADILALVKRIRERVAAVTGVLLEPEIRVVGRSGRSGSWEGE